MSCKWLKELQDKNMYGMQCVVFVIPFFTVSLALYRDDTASQMSELSTLDVNRDDDDDEVLDLSQLQVMVRTVDRVQGRLLRFRGDLYCVCACILL